MGALTAGQVLASFVYFWKHRSFLPVNTLPFEATPHFVSADAYEQPVIDELSTVRQSEVSEKMPLVTASSTDIAAAAVAGAAAVGGAGHSLWLAAVAAVAP